MGSAEFSAPILVSLIENFNVKAVVTETDKLAGRKKTIISPVTKTIADKYEIPCFQPQKVRNNSEFIKDIKDLNPDVVIVCAYGKILPEEFLQIPTYGCVNVHPSLLPVYRGPSPIQTALFNGDLITGISIMLLNDKMDEGDIIYQEKVKINEKEGFKSLSKRLAEKSASILTEQLSNYIAGELTLVKQDDSHASYCQKIKKEDGLINWDSSAEQIMNQMRAFEDWPGTYTYYNGKKIDIIQADIVLDDDKNKPGLIYKKNNQILVKCGLGSLELRELKLEGKNNSSVISFINGHQDFVGSNLG